MKEFAKDLKKFDAISNNLNLNEHPKKRTQSRKVDLLDSFIEGDIQIDDMLIKMNEEKNRSRGGHHAAAIHNNKRISEMFSRNRKDPHVHEIDKAKK